MTSEQGLRPAGETMAAVADTARPKSHAYTIADFLVPGPVAAPHGAPNIWAHMWHEVYRMAHGDAHV